jgi:hypothetical protein
VSPVSRGRKKKTSGRPRRHGAAVPDEDAVAGQVARSFLGAGSEPDPVAVELVASDMAGMFWNRTPPGEDANAAEVALLRAVGRRRDPGALAFLRAFAAVAPSAEVRAEAAAAAESVAGRGAVDPPWASTIGRPVLRECWRLADVYGDTESLVCVFAYGRRRHCLSALVDRGDGEAWIRDLAVLDQPGRVLRQVRKAAAEAGPLATLEQVDPAEARRILTEGLAGADASWRPELPGSYAEHRAVALARCRVLPEPAPAGPAITPAGVPEHRREVIVTDFLASPEAAALPDGDATRYCARLLVDFGADHDSGRVLRVSPAKIERFLHDWLPGNAVLDDSDRMAMPAVVSAWARWAVGRSGLPPEAVDEVIETADECGSHFLAEREGEGAGAAAYLSGLELRDLTEVQDAFDRRLFAMPYLGTRIGDETYPSLDPGDPDERRLLLEGEHPEYHAILADPASDGEIDGVNPRLHIAMHEMIANQLWDGEPPEAWQAAQRLRDRGLDRHEILHRLADVAVEQLHGALTSGTPADAAAYARALDRLAPERTARPAGRSSPVAAADTVVVKVTLRGSTPPIWRRLRLPARTTLSTLHEILQSAFGWTDSHLHQFEAGGRRLSRPDFGLAEGVGEYADESRTRLADVLGAPGDRLRYEYDFGDSWEHDIVVEEVLSERSAAAVCVGGRRAGPPEDCGGVWGYAELCAIMADPGHPEHPERAEWIGGRFDPARFDKDAVNRALRMISIR